MGVALVVIGVIIAIYGYGGAIGIDPQSAVQQTVVELRHLHGVLGLVLVGLGAVYAAVSSRPAPSPEPPTRTVIAEVSERPEPISPRL